MLYGFGTHWENAEPIDVVFASRIITEHAKEYMLKDQWETCKVMPHLFVAQSASSVVLAFEFSKLNPLGPYIVADSE